ncbi:MAG: HAD family hydrolase [Thermoguttaceae bacterium]
MAKAEIAVIFDMDGVLIDTFEAHFESWQVATRLEGLEMSRSQFAETFGRTSREIITFLWPQKSADADAVRELDDRKEEAFRQIIAERFPPMGGAKELLQQLAAGGFGLAVGSSAPPANVAMVIERLGAGELFGAVVTGQDVSRGKPDPQVFLLAAERLAVSPRRCVVVEDAPLGLDAARAAGMRCVGMASTGRTRRQLAHADLVVESPTELSPEVFRRLANGEP